MGNYPAVGLKDARKARDEAKGLLTQGINPSVEKKRQVLVATLQAANTFHLVAEEYSAKEVDDGAARATETKLRWLLKQLEPALGQRPVLEIEAFEVLDVLRKVERKGNPETTHRLRSFASAS